MKLYTLGFTKKSARAFFELLKSHGIGTLVDIRLNNSSQLAGFSKGSDLEYFLAEICNCDYHHELKFAPTKEIMDGFKSGQISLQQFEKLNSDLMAERNALSYFADKYLGCKDVCLLCSEDKPDKCHRRILANLILERLPGTTLLHL
ncbi:MAG: DUF488 domain-containing protein [Firmicutes bacterium]|nr:DUF488 domain-containing protein [Bacillota bacterium]